MSHLSNRLATLVLSVLSFQGVFFLTGEEIFAQDDECRITIIKVAEGADEGETFDFAITFNGQSYIQPIPANQANVFNFELGDIVTVMEDFNEGWVLADFICESNPGIITTVSENGATLECVNPVDDIGIGTCIFFNQRVSAIPALSEWGMIAAFVGLGLIGVFAVMRRKIKAEI